MDTLKRFLKVRKLELCVEKTKILFNDTGKRYRERWKWDNTIIQEVKSF